ADLAADRRAGSLRRGRGNQSLHGDRSAVRSAKSDGGARRRSGKSGGILNECRHRAGALVVRSPQRGGARGEGELNLELEHRSPDPRPHAACEAVATVLCRVSNTQAEAIKISAKPMMSAGVGTSPRIRNDPMTPMTGDASTPSEAVMAGKRRTIV